MAEEKLFENRLKKWLQSKGIYPDGFPMQKMIVPVRGWYVKIWGGGFQKSGIPDIIACINGVFVAMEIKKEKGVEADIQRINIQRINESGGIGVFLYPSGFEAFKELVNEILELGDLVIDKKERYKDGN